MTTPELPARPFPELERLEREALSYAWSMLYLGIGVGFVLAWSMCSMRSCEPPRELVAPRPVAPAPHSVGATSCRDAVTAFGVVPSKPSQLQRFHP